MKKWMFRVLFLIVVASLIYIALRKIDFMEVYLILKYAKPLYLFLAVLAMFLTFISWNFRWTNFFGRLFKNDFWFLLNVLFAGAFFNTITPGAGIAGEPFRAHFLAKRYKQSHVKMLGYVLGDKFYQLMTLAALTVFSVFFVFIYFKISNTLKYILEGILFLVVSLACLALYFTLRKLNFKLGAFAKKLHFFGFLKKNFKSPETLELFVDTKLKFFTKIFRKSVLSKRNLIVGFSLSIIFWGLTYMVSYFLFLAFGYHPNFLSVVVVVTLATMIGDLSLVPSGMGITELSMTLLYSAMGIFPPLALCVSLLARLIYYFFSLGIGGLSLLYVKKVTHENEPLRKALNSEIRQDKLSGNKPSRKAIKTDRISKKKN